MGTPKRIIWHWDAARGALTAKILASYHDTIMPDGSLVQGRHKPEANCVRPLREGHYAAHALNANFESHGINLHGMADAVERPFDPGPSPINKTQVDALILRVAALNREYGIEVSRETNLGHCEVQPTLKIAQRGKWDIAWLPGMDKPGDPVTVGDIIRARIREAMGAKPVERPAHVKPRPVPPTLRRGDRGESVKLLQRGLSVIADGIFGPTTQQVLRDFQSDHGLVADGICGPKTWAALIEKGL